MFSAIVNDHVYNPRNVGPLETATHEGVAGVPGDGPYMVLQFEVGAGKIVRAAYQTYGCPGAIACGSMTAQVLTGRTIEQALRLEEKDLVLLLGGLPEGKEHCPQLAIQALRKALTRSEIP